MSNDSDHSVALKALDWKTLKIERKKAKAKMMYKLLSKMGLSHLPIYLLIKVRRYSYNLRNISGTLCLPQPRTYDG